MIRVTREVGSSEGLFIAPEAAACFAAFKSLRSAGKIVPGERVVIFNTGSGNQVPGLLQRPVISLSHIRLPTKMEMRLAKAFAGSA